MGNDMNGEHHWNEADERRLIELAGTLSMNELGRLFNCSRNAIAGKIARFRRQGLIAESPARTKPEGAPKKRKRKRKPAKAPAKVRTPKPPAGAPAPFTARPEPDVEVRRISLLELAHGDVGDPGFGFCGRPALDGRSYCLEHFRYAHQAVG
jgi:GcrA cell cycle regulator